MSAPHRGAGPRGFRLTPPRRLLAIVLPCMLLQWLALLHSVVHVPGAPTPGWRARADTPCATLACVVLELATSHDSGSTTCQLLDQLCQAMPGAEVPVLGLPQVAAHHSTAWPVSHQPRPVRGRQRARAPPALV